MIYKVQIDNEVREATPNEVARIEQFQSDVQAQSAVVRAKAVAAESARAKLAALGLTEAEIKALVG